jgi:hypothetical protein
MQINERFSFDYLFRRLLRSGFGHEESKDIIVNRFSLSALVCQERIENGYYLKLSTQELIADDLIKLYQDVIRRNSADLCIDPTQHRKRWQRLGKNAQLLIKRINGWRNSSEALATLTQQDCVDYIYQLTIHRTFDGYLAEKSVVHDTLAKEFPDIVFEETDPDLDHAGDIDFIGKVGNKAFGLQIKPITAHASLGNFSVTARMEQSFRHFEKQFGGKVFIVFSVEDKISNKEVISQIRAEIIRLKKK